MSPSAAAAVEARVHKERVENSLRKKRRERAGIKIQANFRGRKEREGRERGRTGRARRTSTSGQSCMKRTTLPAMSAWLPEKEMTCGKSCRTVIEWSGSGLPVSNARRM